MQVAVGTESEMKREIVSEVFVGFEVVYTATPTQKVLGRIETDGDLRYAAIHRVRWVQRQFASAYGVGLQFGVVEEYVVVWAACVDASMQMFVASGPRIPLSVDVSYRWLAKTAMRAAMLGFGWQVR